MWGTIALVGAAAILVAAIFSYRRANTVAEIDSHDSDMSEELASFVYAVNHVNDTSDPAYTKALEGLRGSADRVLSDCARLLGKDSAAPFGIRHSCLLGLSAMRDPAALDLLSAVALNPQPLPPKDPGRHRHNDGALTAGTVLSLDALDGLEALADDGHERAVEALVAAAAIESNAVRALALTALAAKPKRRAAYERARAGLPRELLHLAELTRLPIEQVPQIAEPRLHLAGAEAGSPSAPFLAGTVPAHDRAMEPRNRAPRAGGR